MATIVQTSLPLDQRSARRRVAARRPLKVVGLFAGIGGLELGMAAGGHRTVSLCEIDAAAQAVLRHRFPKVELRPDVEDYDDLPEGTELITAGFPCQDLSQAGRTRGIEGARSGLVGHVFRLLGTHDVPWVLMENVPFMLQLARGEALRVIIDSLEHLEYKWAYRVVNTLAFGLPQRRERVFILASREHDPRDVLLADDAGETAAHGEVGEVACGFYWTEGLRGLGWAVDAVPTLKGGSTIGIPSPPAVVLPDGRVVKPSIADAERMQGFDAGWTEAAEHVGKRSHRWKLVGNAVTVDVAAWIGERLRRPGLYATAGDAPLPEGKPWPKAAYNVGEGRFAAHVSRYPVARQRTPLADFLDPDGLEDLSLKAISGFLSRFEAGTLARPTGFLEALHAHKRRMERAAR